MTESTPSISQVSQRMIQTSTALNSKLGDKNVVLIKDKKGWHAIEGLSGLSRIWRKAMAYLNPNEVIYHAEERATQEVVESGKKLYTLYDGKVKAISLAEGTLSLEGISGWAKSIADVKAAVEALKSFVEKTGNETAGATVFSIGEANNKGVKIVEEEIARLTGEMRGLTGAAYLKKSLPLILLRDASLGDPNLADLFKTVPSTKAITGDTRQPLRNLIDELDKDDRRSLTVIMQEAKSIQQEVGELQLPKDLGELPKILQRDFEALQKKIEAKRNQALADIAKYDGEIEVAKQKQVARIGEYEAHQSGAQEVAMDASRRLGDDMNAVRTVSESLKKSPLKIGILTSATAFINNEDAKLKRDTQLIELLLYLSLPESEAKKDPKTLSKIAALAKALDIVGPLDRNIFLENRSLYQQAEALAKDLGFIRFRAVRENELFFEAFDTVLNAMAKANRKKQATEPSRVGLAFLENEIKQAQNQLVTATERQLAARRRLTEANEALNV